MQEFKEPKPNAIVTSMCKVILPFWLRLKEHLSISVRGTQQDIDAFSRSSRAVVLLNHPDRQDPFVIFELANKMHEEFYCIAARECFDWDDGWRGWLFQSLGCYSVARGKADFHSIATTKKVLREGRRKLLVFPEAEITADESTLHELHKAIFHIALSVQKELSNNASVDPDNQVRLIPAAIRFSLDTELESAVGPALQRMEESLELSAAENATVFVRIDAVVNAYLSLVFEVYDLQKPQASQQQLAEFLSVEILHKIATNIGMTWDVSLSPTEQLYAIRNTVAGNTDIDTVAVRPNVFQCAGIANPCLISDLERIERLLIMHRMLEHPSSEIQCCRILDFIECELYGTITPKGWQSAVILLGTPIEVSSFVDHFSVSKEDGVERLSEHFKGKLQGMLMDKSLLNAAGTHESAQHDAHIAQVSLESLKKNSS